MSDSSLGGSLMKMENWKCNIPADLSYANAEAPLFTASSSRRILPRDLLNPRASRENAVRGRVVPTGSGCARLFCRIAAAMQPSLNSLRQVKGCSNLLVARSFENAFQHGFFTNAKRRFEVAVLRALRGEIGRAHV